MHKNTIWITERGDPAYDLSWLPYAIKKMPGIIITKSPGIIYNILKNFHIKNVIVHSTITGMGATQIEPNVCDTKTAIHYTSKLIAYLGDEKVVLRIDPIIPCNENINIIIKEILCKLITKPRIRISFMDQYCHVRERLNKIGITLPWKGLHAPILLRKRYFAKLQKAYPAWNIETCAEPGFDSSNIGCISLFDCNVLQVPIEKQTKQQRNGCKCFGNKFEVLKSPQQCLHACLYCYWKIDNINV